MSEWPHAPFRLEYACAFVLVGYELAAKPGVDFWRVDKHSGLEIVFEAAEVEVGGADG